MLACASGVLIAGGIRRVKRLHPIPERTIGSIKENNLKGALIGVAAARLRDYIGELLPDFVEHYRRVEQDTSGPDSLRSARR